MRRLAVAGFGAKGGAVTQAGTGPTLPDNQNRRKPDANSRDPGLKSICGGIAPEELHSLVSIYVALEGEPGAKRNGLPDRDQPTRGGACPALAVDFSEPLEAGGPCCGSGRCKTRTEYDK